MVTFSQSSSLLGGEDAIGASVTLADAADDRLFVAEQH